MRLFLSWMAELNEERLLSRIRQALLKPAWRAASLSQVCRRDIELRVHSWKPQKQTLYTAMSPGCPGSSPPEGEKKRKIFKNVMMMIKRLQAHVSFRIFIFSNIFKKENSNKNSTV